MLNQTTITGLRTILHVGLAPTEEPLSIRRIAEGLGESPSYMAKVARLLAKAGILRARRGVMGGIELNRPPEAITLLHIVEACQGAILPDFCEETREDTGTCSFHAAAAELHEAIVGVLSRWTLGHLLRQPAAPRGACREIPCTMAACVSAVLKATDTGPSLERAATGARRTTSRGSGGGRR